MAANTSISNIVSLVDERLIRRTPDYPLPLAEEDFAYIETCLAAVDRVFPPERRGGRLVDLPVRLLPARALARLLTSLRRDLRPATAEQRLAHGMLWGALGLLNTARAMAAERDPAPQECNGGGNILNL
ncbi:MAG TPA: hypothetical protein PKZ97_12050 [Azospirillaceae bacterium]|nr:hypothetical protein [Azospirillaceae bacterium]